MPEFCRPLGLASPSLGSTETLLQLPPLLFLYFPPPLVSKPIPDRKKRKVVKTPSHPPPIIHHPCIHPIPFHAPPPPFPAPLTPT